MANTVYDSTATRSDRWYRDRIEYMAEFMMPERLENFGKVLETRTRWITICCENTFHTQNASALIRTCEAFGLQDIHAIETLCKFKPNVNIVRGTDKWIDLKRHKSPAEAIAAMRAAGYRIIATTPHADDSTPLDFDIAAGPAALVFGTEHAGISQEIIAAADGFVKIPMCGFVESLNVSASAAILLYNLTEKMRSDPSIPWRLEESEKTRLLFKWIMSSVRDSKTILARRFPEM